MKLAGSGIPTKFLAATVPNFVPTSKSDELGSVAMRFGVSPRGIATYRNSLCHRKCDKSFVFG